MFIFRKLTRVDIDSITMPFRGRLHPFMTLCKLKFVVFFIQQDIKTCGKKTKEEQIKHFKPDHSTEDYSVLFKTYLQLSFGKQELTFSYIFVYIVDVYEPYITHLNSPFYSSTSCKRVYIKTFIPTPLSFHEICI